MAEALLRDRLATARASPPGSPRPGCTRRGARPRPTRVEVMADRGPRPRRPPQPPASTADRVARPTSIIGMTREHVREVAVLDAGRRWPARSPSRSSSRPGDAVGPAQPGETARRAGWPASAPAAARDALLGVGHDDAYDVADPIGGPRAQLPRPPPTELDGLLDRLVALACGPSAGPEPPRSAAA